MYMAYVLRMCANTVVSRKYAPPFATLVLVQNVGGAYTRDATISLAITPSLPVKHDIVGGGWGPSARRRDAPDASGRLTSFSVERREVAGVSIVDVGGPCSR